MKRRKFLKALGAAVALMAADPMFGGTAWGMDRGIDRGPRIVVLEPGASIELYPNKDGTWLVGHPQQGPVNRAELINNFDEFTEAFGDIPGWQETVVDNPWQRAYGHTLKPGPERQIGGLVDEDGANVLINVGADPITFMHVKSGRLAREAVDKIEKFLDEEVHPGPFRPVKFTEE